MTKQGRRAAQRWPEAARWAACFALALFFHVAGATAMLMHWQDSADSIASAPVVLVDLAPVAVAPDVTPTELPPGPQQNEEQEEPKPEPQKPLEKVELPHDPQAEPLPVEPPTPPEKPKEKKPKHKHTTLASAPTTAEQKSEHMAAPAPGASTHNSDAVPNWKSRLVAQLERNKRYPSEAQSRGEHGVAQLSFSIDRQGGVHHARIARSSGSSLLDQATLAMIERAQPLPPPPPEMPGAQIPISVPIRYSIR